MLILLEGPDGAGKTTLAERLKDKLNSHYDARPESVEVRHFGPPLVPALFEYLQGIADYTPGTKHIICDRYHVGETIYGPIYRGRSELAGTPFEFIEKWLDFHGAVIVHVTRDIDQLVKTIHERGDDYVNPKHMFQITVEYDHHFKVHRTLPTFEARDFEWPIEDILACAAQRELEVNELYR